MFRDTNVGKYQKSSRLFNQTYVLRYKQLRILPESGRQLEALLGVKAGGGLIGVGIPAPPGEPGNPVDPGNPDDPGNSGGPGGKKPGC